MVEDAVRTRGLTKRYGETVAVRALDLTVRAGEVYGFLGLNGAGKTTTVRMLTGVLPPTGGQALVFGVDVAEDARAVAPRIGGVFGENLAPEPGWSPVRYLRHFGRLHGMDRVEVMERARGLFEVLRLEEFAERPIGKLSGGNRRKVELARALLHGPDLLFLDEPTRELDIPAKRAVWRFLQGLAAEEGLTIFLSSHDTEEIATLCTRVGILRNGRLRWEGRPSDLTGGGAGLADALAELLEEAPAADQAAKAPSSP